MPDTQLQASTDRVSADTPRQRIRWYIVVFLAPATLIYTVFAIYPIFESLRMSLFVAADEGRQFVGIENYTRLLTEPYWADQFWNALKNNIVLFGMHMLIQNPIATGTGSSTQCARLERRCHLPHDTVLPTLLPWWLSGLSGS